jgi:DUF971 family protein
MRSHCIHHTPGEFANGFNDRCRIFMPGLERLWKFLKNRIDTDTDRRTLARYGIQKPIGSMTQVNSGRGHAKYCTVRPALGQPTGFSYNDAIDARPVHLDLKQDRGLSIQWEGGTSSFYPIAYLRKMSPSADAKALREELSRNPLTVLPGSGGKSKGPLRATNIEFVGNYAIRIVFSDGHETGIYSWKYLREIDPDKAAPISKTTETRSRKGGST